MNYYKQALEADIQGDYKEAIEKYFSSISNDENELNAYLNLFVILTEICFDYGVESYLITRNVFSESEIRKFCARCESIIEEAEKKFASKEVLFWRYYRDQYYKDFDRDATLKFTRESESLVPYFYLYCNDIVNDEDISIYRNQMEDLKEELSRLKTFKNKYIISLIKSAENISDKFNDGYDF